LYYCPHTFPILHIKLYILGWQHAFLLATATSTQTLSNKIDIDVPRRKRMERGR